MGGLYLFTAEDHSGRTPSYSAHIRHALHLALINPAPAPPPPVIACFRMHDLMKLFEHRYARAYTRQRFSST